jgi:hypothetical protein
MFDQRNLRNAAVAIPGLVVLVAPAESLGSGRDSEGEVLHETGQVGTRGHGAVPSIGIG